MLILFPYTKQINTDKLIAKICAYLQQQQQQK